MHLKIVALVLTVAACTARDSASEKVLERPLITGASVSADYKSVSPGKKLALKYTSAGNIKTIAIPGRTGRDVLATITPADLADRTIIIAIDFFFWDSAMVDLNASKAAIDDLISRAEKLNIPIVVAEIPELKPGQQPDRPALNEAITKRCAAYARCYLLPYDQIHQQILRDGFLLIDGEKYTMAQLLPDGLHLADITGNYLATAIENLLKREVK